MPSPISALRADNVTAIAYTPLVGATERSPAVWRQDAGQPVALPVGMRACLELGSQNNGPKTARRLPFKYWFPFPVLSADTNSYTSKDMVLITGTITLPNAIPAATQAEAVHQCFTALSTLAIRQAISTGYAPT